MTVFGLNPTYIKNVWQPMLPVHGTAYKKSTQFRNRSRHLVWPSFRTWKS